MLNIITQDGLAKYEIHNYELITSPGKVPFVQSSVHYISTPDVGGKHLAAYASLEQAKEVFESMIELEQKNSGAMFMMPLEEVV